MTDPADAFDAATPSEKLAWLTDDPDGYYAAAHAWADDLVEREARRERRRRAQANRDRARHWFHLIVGALGRRP